MKKLVPLVFVVSILVLPGPAQAVAPNTGCYGGGMNDAVSHEHDGNFRVKNTSSGKKIVPSAGSCEPGFSKILAPSTGECNQINAYLETERIPINSGAFDYTGDAPIGPGGANRHVRFKGHWVTQSKAKGFTRIRGGGCDSEKDYWTMKTPPPA